MDKVMSKDKGEIRSAEIQLLDAASEIMRKGDTIDLSFSELSAKAGLNSALVKYYFGNKNGLMRALLDRNMTRIVHDLDALVQKNMPAKDKVHLHISKAIDTYYDYPYLNRLLMRLVRDNPTKEANNIAKEYLIPISKSYEKLVKDGISEGVFLDIDPQMFYFTVTGAADRFFSARLVLRHCYNQHDITEDMRDEYREHTVNLIMRGILK